MADDGHDDLAGGHVSITTGSAQSYPSTTLEIGRG